MAKHPPLAAVPSEGDVVDYLARVRANLGLIVKTYRKAQVSRWTGISDQTLTNMLNEDPEDSWKGAGQLRTFLELATYMDIPPSLWFLPTEEFAAAVAARNPSPFFAPPRSPSSSGSGLTASGAHERDRSRYGRSRRKPPAEEAGKGYSPQTPFDQAA